METYVIYNIITIYRGRHTEFKQLTVCTQFPKDYPQERLIVEIKSKTIPEKLLNRLVSVCDLELNKHLGNAQVCAKINGCINILTIICITRA